MKEIRNDSYKYINHSFSNRLLSGTRESRVELIILSVLIAIMIGLVLLLNCVSLCRIDGKSMNDTLQDSDNVLLSRVSTSFGREDIVVFHYNGGENPADYIKRIIGVEGDTLRFENDNGVIELYRKKSGTSSYDKVVESYIAEAMKQQHFDMRIIGAFGREITVGKDEYFVMGDNRNNSSDSRSIGMVKEDDIVGKMLFKIEEGSFIEWFFFTLYHEGSSLNNYKYYRQHRM